MSDIKPDTFPKAKKNPVFDGMPAHLKDPANYDKINRLILEQLASPHSHSEVIDWAGCAKCQEKFAGKWKLMQKLGFRSAAQYMAWKKVHETIKERVPLPKYNG